MDPNREVEEELLQREEEEIAQLPEGSEERRMREAILAQLREMARHVDLPEDIPVEIPQLIETSESSEASADQSQTDDIYKKRHQEISDALMARILHEQTNHPDMQRQQTEHDTSRPRCSGPSNQALAEAEALAPWLRETRRRADSLVIELTNMINALYHTPARNSAPEISTIPIGWRPIRGRSSTGEPVYEPAGREVPRNAFYWNIRERMTTVLARAMQFRNSIPMTGNAETQTLPTPESPPLVLFGEQGSSFDYPSSLEGAIGSTPSQVQTPEDCDNMNLGESASGYRETDSFSSDVKMYSRNPNRRSRTTEERRSDWQRDPFVSRSPPAKNSRSKVPTPLDKSDKKPSEKDGYKKTFKKVTKQPEKEMPKTPAKKSSKSGFPKSSEKESSEKSKGHKKRKEDTAQTSRSEQRSRTSSMYGARPKTSASSVWNATAPPLWEASSSDPALDVRTPVEESPSPSTGYTSVAHSPVCQSTLGNIDCADVDNSLPTVNQPVDEFSRTFSSVQFTLPSQPFREGTTRVRHASQAHNAELDTRALKLESPPQSPSVSRPLGGDASDIGASGSNEASNIDIDMSALKLESPASSPTDNIPSSRGIGALNEVRERRIANVRSPSNANRNDKAMESPSQTRRVMYKSFHKAVASDETSQNKSTKFTASLPKSISVSVPKGAANVQRGAASVPKGASNTNLSKEPSTRPSKTASISRLPNDRSRIISKDGFRSMSSKQGHGIPTKEIGTSTGAPQRSAIRGIEGASSTPSSKVDNVQRRAGGGSSKASKDLPFSLTKKTPCIQSPREINASRRTASKIASVRKKTTSAQSSETTASGKVGVPLGDSTGMVPQETSAQSLEPTASGKETVANEPFAESADNVPQETSSSKSLEATASEKKTSVRGQFNKSAKIVLKEASAQSSIVTESNNESGVAEGASGVNISNVEDSQALTVDSASSESKLQKVLEVLEPCQMGESSEPAEQTNPVLRKSEPMVRRKTTETSPRKYHSM